MVTYNGNHDDTKDYSDNTQCQQPVTDDGSARSLWPHRKNKIKNPGSSLEDKFVLRSGYLVKGLYTECIPYNNDNNYNYISD